jgi:hypothetical protein
VMRLLLNRRGSEVQVTENVAITAEIRWAMEKQLLALITALLNHDGEIQITEDVVKAAAGDKGTREELMMALLLNRTVADMQYEDTNIESSGDSEGGNEVSSEHDEDDVRSDPPTTI